MPKLQTKLAALRRTVALPDTDDWQLLDDNPEHIVAELNAALVKCLETIKQKKINDYKAEQLIMRAVSRIDRKHPNADILSSEGRETIALFFAVNYDPRMYTSLRYY